MICQAETPEDDSCFTSCLIILGIRRIWCAIGVKDASWLRSGLQTLNAQIPFSSLPWTENGQPISWEPVSRIRLLSLRPLPSYWPLRSQPKFTVPSQLQDRRVVTAYPSLIVWAEIASFRAFREGYPLIWDGGRRFIFVAGYGVVDVVTGLARLKMQCASRRVTWMYLVQQQKSVFYLSCTSLKRLCNEGTI